MRALPWVAAALLAVLAGFALVPAFAELIADGGDDLAARVDESRQLWGRISPWGRGPTAAVYPPATYVLHGPLSFFSERTVAWMWGVSALLLVAWLGSALARQAQEAVAPVAFAAAFAIHGVAHGLAAGQLHVHTTAAAVLACLLLIQRHGSWGTDALGALLMICALAKPTLAAPFVLLLLPGRRRPLLLVVGGYVALTGVGLALVGEGLRPLVLWLDVAREGVEFGAQGSYANVHALTQWLGLDRANTVLSVALLGGLLAWALSLPDDDDLDRTWVRLGLVAVFARVFAYHQSYDDALLILTLGGLVTAARVRSARPALAVFGAIVVAQLAPPSLLGLESPTPGVLPVMRLALWLAAAWLLWRAQQSGYPRRGTEGNGGGQDT